MEFSVLADAFSKMESTTKRLELTQDLVELFEKTPQDVISRIVYLLQGKLRPDFEGIELGVAEKLAIMCGEHCKIFRALVPNSAKSAATMWALSADKILMGIYQR